MKNTAQTPAQPAKQSLRQLTDDFLAQKHIAVAGVSREEKTAPGNLIYNKLKEAGHSVYALNPKTKEIDGDPCYHDLGSLPVVPDGVVIATPPEATLKVAEACVALGVSRVWIHRSFGQGSVSEEAVRLCKEKGIPVIAGACPMMYCKPVDFAHRCMRGILGLTGGLPKPG